MTLQARWRNTHGWCFVFVAGAIAAGATTGIALDPAAEITFLVLMVALFGVPHGALDASVAEAGGLARRPAQTFAFMSGYAVQAGLAALLWVTVPGTALFLFLLLSVWHFAGDWTRDLSTWRAVLASTVIVSAPALFHEAETSAIFAVLTDGDSAASLAGLLHWIAKIASPALVAVALVDLPSRPRAALEHASLPALAWLLDPLVFFTVYFCGLHSPRHCIEVLPHLQASRRRIGAYAAALTGVTLTLAAAAFLTLRGSPVSDRAIQVVFVGLFALTVPHMVLLARTRRSLAVPAS